MNDKLVINLKIADMKLSFTINRDEEALYRESAAGRNQVAPLFAKGYISLDSDIRQLETHLDGFESALDRILLPDD